MSYFLPLFEMDDASVASETTHAIRGFRDRKVLSDGRDTHRLLDSLLESKTDQFEYTLGRMEIFFNHLWGLAEKDGLSQEEVILLTDLLLRQYLSESDIQKQMIDFYISYLNYRADNEHTTAAIQSRLKTSSHVQSVLDISTHAVGYQLFRLGQKTLLTLINRGRSEDESLDAEAKTEKAAIRIYAFEREDEAALVAEIVDINHELRPYTYIEEVILDGGTLLAKQDLKDQNHANCSVVCARHLLRLGRFTDQLQAVVSDSVEDESLLRAVTQKMLKRHYSEDKTLGHLARFHSLSMMATLLNFSGKSYARLSSFDKKLHVLLQKMEKSKSYLADKYDLDWPAALNQICEAMIRFTLAIPNDDKDKSTALTHALNIAEQRFKQACPAIIVALVGHLEGDKASLDDLQKRVKQGLYPINGADIASALVQQQLVQKPTLSFSEIYAYCSACADFMPEFVHYLREAAQDSDILWARMGNPTDLTILLRFIAPHDRLAFYENLLDTAQTSVNFFCQLLVDKKRLEWFSEQLQSDLRAQGVAAESISRINSGFQQVFEKEHRPRPASPRFITAELFRRPPSASLRTDNPFRVLER